MTPAEQVHHEITIELTGVANGRLAAVPTIPPEMRVGDTMSYSSPDGSFRVEFDDGSPFGEPGPGAITDSRILTLVKEGRVSSRCFLTVGWSAEFPESGGAQDVKPR